MEKIIENEKLEAFLTTWQNKRLEELGEEFEAGKDYAAHSAKEEELYNRLGDSLPEELKPLLNEYSDTLNEIMTLYEDFMGRNCFLDGVRFMGALGGKT